MVWTYELSDSEFDIPEQQKVCLRLVGRGHSSKEIAIRTGLSPLTVDTYLKSAMGRFGVSNRREAARFLERFEMSQELGSLPREVGVVAMDAQPRPVATARGLIDYLALPPVGGRPNDLSAAERTFAVLRVAAIGLAVISAITLVLAGVFRTFS